MLLFTEHAKFTENYWHFIVITLRFEGGPDVVVSHCPWLKQWLLLAGCHTAVDGGGGRGGGVSLVSALGKLKSFATFPFIKTLIL